MSIQLTMTGEITHSREITLKDAAQILGFLGTLDSQQHEGSLINQQNTVVTVPTNPNFGLTTNKNPRQILIDSNAKTFAQKVTAFAVYLCNTQNTNIFSPDEIRSLFNKTGESYPKNVTREWKSAILENYIFKSDEREGYFELTDYGKESVENGFKSKSVHRKKSRQYTNIEKKNIPDEIKNVRWETSIAGYPMYSNMKTGSDRILWALKFAKLNNIESLSQSEIEFATMQLGQIVRSKHIASLNKRNISKGYCAKQLNKLILQNNGDEYLKSLLDGELAER